MLYFFFVEINLGGSFFMGFFRFYFRYVFFFVDFLDVIDFYFFFF